MKIVHVIPALTKGGAERVVVELANHAAASGHSVTVLAAVAAPAHLLADRLSPQVSLQFIRPSGLRPRRSYPSLPLWIFRNRRWLFEQDVIHCHLTLGAVFGILLHGIKRIAGRDRPAIVETYHAVAMGIPKWRRTLHAALLSGRDGAALMAEDGYWRKFVAARPRNLIRIIPNGIAEPSPLAASDSYRRAAGIPEDAFVVGSVGRLVPDRRPELLLDTFAQLAKEANEDLHLLLAGDGVERARLATRARELGLADRVHLPGLAVDPAEPMGVIALYLTLNIGPLTGIAALEAAFAGVPIVALQLDPTYRPDPGDWIWSSPEPAELAARAGELIRSPELLADLAARQQAHVRSHFSVEAMALAYERLYQDALAPRAASR